MPTVEQIKAEVVADVSGLKAGLGQAKAAVTDFAKTIKSEGDRMNASAAEFMKSLDKEAAATKVLTEAKRQQITFDRELRAAKAQLTVVLNEESTAAERVARQYNLLGASVRQQLVRVEEQITAQKALQQAELATAAAAEKAAAAQVAASQKAAAATEAAAAKQLAAARKNLGQNVQTVGRSLTSALTPPIVGAALAAGYAGNEVQQAEAGLRAGTGLTGNALAGVEESFRRVAPQVSQSLKEVSAAVGELERRTGLTGPALEKLAVTELNLQRIAGAGKETFQQSAQLFAAWNVPIEQQIPLLNEVYRAHQQTGISVNALLQSVTRTAPTFREMGKSVEDSIATFAAFNKVGVQPERLITAMNTAMSKLAKAGVPDVAKAMADMMQRIKNLKNPTEAMNEAVRLFGARGGTQLADALRTGKLSIEELEASIKRGSQTINQSAKDTETLSVTWGKMRNSLLIALAPLGKVLIQLAVIVANGLKPAIEWLGKMLEAFSKLPPGTQRLILGLVAFVAAVGPVVTWVGTLITAFGKLQLAWEAISLAWSAATAGGGVLVVLEGALTALLGPLGLVLLAVGALALAWETNFLHIRDVTKSAVDATSESLNRLAPRVAREESLPSFVGTGDAAADLAAMASMDSMKKAEKQRVAAAVSPPVTAKGLMASGFASHLGTGGPLTIPTVTSGGTGVPSLTDAERKALALQKTALDVEQKRYTEELTTAKAKLVELMSGEDKIAAQVAGRYHELSASQRANLTAVLEQIETYTELNKVHDKMAKNNRLVTLLKQGETVEVARAAVEYDHLSLTQLRSFEANEKAAQAAIKTAESYKEYTKDIHKLEAEIHRLKLGHDAEASGVDALREKYPGLSTAMLAAMNNAIQWKKHLVELRQEAHRVEEAIRGIQVTVLEAGAGNRVDEAAARLFGPALLEKGKRPKSAGDLFKNYLTPEQQIEAQTEAGTSAFASIDQQLAAARQNLFQNYGTLRDKKTVGLKDREGQIFSAAVGQNPGSYLSDEQRKQLMEKAEALIKVKDAADQATAAISVYNGEFDKINTVSGQAQVNLDLLHRHFDAMTGSNQLAKDVMERFGVVLSTLPPKIQAIIKEFIKLDKAQQAYQDFADGVTSVFNTAFLNLTHGFKSFYQSIVQGFEQMLQEMAAKYLASQLANAFLNLLGSAFGGKEAFAQILGSISGKASGGLVAQDTPYLVGERGPELFTPSRSGRITPNAQLAGAGGGGPIHITMNIATPDAGSFRRSQHQISQDATRAIREASRRSGR